MDSSDDGESDLVVIIRSSIMRLLFVVFESMISIMFVNLSVRRSHMHLFVITNTQLIYFFIKFVLNLSKFLTMAIMDIL
jgi:hypothetical protein